MPPVHKVWWWSPGGQGVILTRWRFLMRMRSTLPVPCAFPTFKTPIPDVWWALLGEKPTETGQILQNGVNKEPSWCLPDHPDGVGPSQHPSLHCPHPVDDFRLLKCVIITFLAWDMAPQSQKYQKMEKKCHIFMRVGLWFGLLRGQIRSKSKKKKIPLKALFVLLMVDTKSFSLLPCLPEL